MSDSVGSLLAASDPTAQPTNHTTTLWWSVGIAFVLILVIFGIIVGVVILRNRHGKTVT